MSFYGFLNTIWRRERQNEKLIDLDNDFFVQARRYLNHLQTQVTTAEDELDKELFRKRSERATFLVNDLINLRIQKHIKETLDGNFHNEDKKKIPHEERDFRKKLEKLTTTFRESVHGLNEIEDQEDEKFQLVLMKEAENVSFLDIDQREYGPFKPNDIVFLDNSNAKRLVNNSKAEKLRIDI